MLTPGPRGLTSDARCSMGHPARHRLCQTCLCLLFFFFFASQPASTSPAPKNRQVRRPLKEPPRTYWPFSSPSRPSPPPPPSIPIIFINIYSLTITLPSRPSPHISPAPRAVRLAAVTGLHARLNRHLPPARPSFDCHRRLFRRHAWPLREACRRPRDGWRPRHSRPDTAR